MGKKNLWNIADTLRDKMGADEFRDYILGYVLKPSELFQKLPEKGAQKVDNFVLEELTAVLKHGMLFRDASQHFEKVGNQNQLCPEDIERIVSAYRKRCHADIATQTFKRGLLLLSCRSRSHLLLSSVFDGCQ